MTSEAVIHRLVHRLYGSSIIRNDVRGEIVEEIVAMALEPVWRGCGGDWAGCDLIHSQNGLRIQVKQSAARQTWSKEGSRPARPCFSIKEKTGRWEDGDRWIEGRSRNAEIFIFAWHPVTGSEADHRDPEQWQFFVVPEQNLPNQSSISLSRIRTIAEPVNFQQLQQLVQQVTSELN